jgi:hypothetical protein
MSSAEAFIMMLDQCPQVVRMGDWTAGASANPRKIKVAGEITVNLPRWIAMDASGRVFENIGLAPDIPVRVSREFFAGNRDPVLEEALRRIRSGL